MRVLLYQKAPFNSTKEVFIRSLGQWEGSLVGFARVKKCELHSNAGAQYIYVCYLPYVYETIKLNYFFVTVKCDKVLALFTKSYSFFGSD